MTALAGFGRAGGAMAASLVVAGMLMLLAGHDPVGAYAAMARGVFGSPDRIAVALNRATPYLLAGSGVALCFRAGLANIGAEGQIALGGLAAAAAALLAPGWLPGLAMPAAALLAAATAGAAWSALAGVLRVWRGVHEVLSTLLLNFVAALLVAEALHGDMGEDGSGFPQSPMLDPSAWLPPLVQGLELHAGAPAALLAAAVLQAVLWRTVPGFQWRLLGFSPRAARYAGVPVARATVAVMAVGGALAGVAGGVEVLGVHQRLIEGFSAGFGFAAVAIALVAAAEPLAVVPAAVFFAALETGSQAMQRATGVPSSLVLVIQGLTLLFVLAGLGRRA